MTKEYIWIGDGIRALEPNELVGKTYNGGVVISNDYLTVTVKYPLSSLPGMIFARLRRLFAKDDSAHV